MSCPCENLKLTAPLRQHQQYFDIKTRLQVKIILIMPFNFLRKLFSRWQIYVDVPNVSIIIGYLHKYVNKNCWTNSRDTSYLRHCDRRSSDVTVMFLVTSLTHWGRVTHMCVNKLTIIGLANGLSPGRRRVIISTNAGILLIWPLGTNFSEIYIKIRTFPFKKMRLKCVVCEMATILSRPQCVNYGEVIVTVYG